MTPTKTPTAPSAEEISNWARGMAALAALARKKLPPKQRSEMARHAANVRWQGAKKKA